MSYIDEAKRICKNAITEYPDIKPDVVELYALFLEESEDGSDAHEFELLEDAISELIEEEKEA